MKAKALIFSFFSLFLLVGAHQLTRLTPTVKPLAEGESFEGTISFTKKVGSSESKYNYLVKGKMVRIEELDANNKIQGIMLVNTKANTILALNPERKLYMNVPNDRTVNIPKAVLTKGTTPKTLQGYSTTEWKLTNKEDDRVMSYWLASDNFDFFVPLLKTLNRRDKQAVYFLSMKEVEGAFPMLGIESKTDGTELSRLTVTSISKKSLEDSVFEIPAGYSKFE